MQKGIAPFFVTVQIEASTNVVKNIARLLEDPMVSCDVPLMHVTALELVCGVYRINLSP